MGGRGRGRGGGKPMSLNVEALGFGRGGDAMPTASAQPPPLFPPLEQHPLPLEQSEKVNYLISLKHDFQTFMEDSPYYVKRNEGKKDIMRYSDKYKVSSNATSESGTILYFRMPEELRPKTGKGKVKKKKKVKDLSATIAALEKKETEGGDEAAAGSDADGGDKSDDDDEDQVDGDEEILDEDEMEEDNDYIQEYFDNGEGFGADEDDAIDNEPTY